MSNATSTRRKYHHRTDPDCPADRHRPGHESYLRGCRCPETVAAEQRRAARPKPAARRTRRQEVPGCRGVTHSATETAYRNGCRCAGAVAAHDGRVAITRAGRARALAEWERTGECAAVNHDSVAAYRRHGCRCSLAVKLDAAKRGREAEIKGRLRDTPTNPWRTPASAMTIFMVTNGGRESRLTVSEVIAADEILSRRRTAYSAFRSRPLITSEIAAILGVDTQTLIRARRERARRREERTMRRLADVRMRAWRRG